MSSPIIMPVMVPTHSEPEYCPSCHAAAEKKVIEICAHCRYEYPSDDGLTGWDFLAMLVIIVIFLWIVFTILIWLTGGGEPLLDILKAQWRWFADLRIW